MIHKSQIIIPLTVDDKNPKQLYFQDISCPENFDLRQVIKTLLSVAVVLAAKYTNLTIGNFTSLIVELFFECNRKDF